MAGIRSVYQRPLSSLDTMGEQLSFYLRALAATPRSVKRYPKEILRILADAGIPTVIFGPHGTGAHADEEWVDVASLEHCRQIYVRAARSFCGGQGER